MGSELYHNIDYFSFGPASPEPVPPSHCITTNVGRMLAAKAPHATHVRAVRTSAHSPVTAAVPIVANASRRCAGCAGALR